MFSGVFVVGEVEVVCHHNFLLSFLKFYGFHFSMFCIFGVVSGGYKIL